MENAHFGKDLSCRSVRINVKRSEPKEFVDLGGVHHGRG